MKTSNLTIQKHLTYRGVKYNPNKISRDNQKSSSNFGVYRGVKHSGDTEDSTKMESGSYRGVKWNGRP